MKQQIATSPGRVFTESWAIEWDVNAGFVISCTRNGGRCTRNGK